MGIKYLNTYIKTSTTNKSIQKLKLNYLSNRIIAVDTSIYLYKFLYNGELFESIYQMLCIFYYYNIIPIFVFDGKAPLQKIELIKKRNHEKNEAEIEYNNLKNLLLMNNSNANYNNIINKMNNLKKKFIRINKDDIIQIKELINAFGYNYIQAECEADIVCSALVVKKIAYACLSEDTDMFLYGCEKVLRYFSILNHSVVLYDLNNILYELKITFKEFKEICILSGTDYDTDNNKNLYKSLELFKSYKNSNNDDFSSWINENTNFNYKDFEKINNLFMIDNKLLENYNILEITKSNNIDFNLIKNIMQNKDFIFVN